jgi:hypothetical protein
VRPEALEGSPISTCASRLQLLRSAKVKGHSVFQQCHVYSDVVTETNYRPDWKRKIVLDKAKTSNN